MMRMVGVALVVFAGLGAMASADPLTGKAAKKLLFAPVEAEVEIMTGANLPADQAAILQSVGGAQPYYGAIAIAPGEGLMSEATVAAANYHDTGAAEVAALAECNAKKKPGPDCVIAALIRPKGWSDTGLGLSSDATVAFKRYKMGKGAFAVSPATGAWGIAAGDGAGDAAVAACVAKNAKATDCAVVIAN